MTAPVRLSAQLTLAWDGATLRVEAPGRNGSRQKVEGISFSDLPQDLRNHLTSEIEAQRDQSRKATQQTQNQNIRYVSQSHGRGVAASVWHDGELAFNRSWKKHLAGEVGNLSVSPRDAGSKAQGTNTSAKAPTVSTTTLDRLGISQTEIKKGLDL